MFRGLILFSILVLNACTSAKVVGGWSEQIVSRQFFIEYYQQDAANKALMSEHVYLTWVRRFYEGWELYPRGWLKTIKEVVATVPDWEEARVGRQMLRIGRSVAAEWAKSRNYRLINTRHLSIYGGMLCVIMAQIERWRQA